MYGIFVVALIEQEFQHVFVLVAPFRFIGRQEISGSGQILADDLGEERMGGLAAKGLELGLPVVLHVLQGRLFHDRPGQRHVGNDLEADVVPILGGGQVLDQQVNGPVWEIIAIDAVGGFVHTGNEEQTLVVDFGGGDVAVGVRVQGDRLHALRVGEPQQGPTVLGDGYAVVGCGIRDFGNGVLTEKPVFPTSGGSQNGTP